MCAPNFMANILKVKAFFSKLQMRLKKSNGQTNRLILLSLEPDSRAENELFKQPQSITKLYSAVFFVAYKSSALSVSRFCCPLPWLVCSFLMRPSVSPSYPLYFLSESEKVACVSWSINWSWFCLSLPGRLAALMKLLNEAERGHLCSDPSDHACLWHGQRRWHLEANYTDFTPARV